MKVLILAPRLDVMFKRGPIPLERGPIEPIRTHWANIVNKLEKEHLSRKDTVRKIELPLWQFSPELVEELSPDLVYIPHKEYHNFPIKTCIPRYYMQMVFPEIFSIDSKGWCAGSSRYPYDDFITNGNPEGPEFDKLSLRILRNESKFAQPVVNNKQLPIDYVFFPLQIPHDETIRNHSTVSVESALEQVCEVTRKRMMSLVIKPHPVNPGSMISLYNIAKKYPHALWVDDISIHQALKECRVCVMVNSGTGMESLLHKKPVIVFGRADYDCVANKVVNNNLEDLLLNPIYNEIKVRKFFNSWYNWCYDSSIKM